MNQALFSYIAACPTAFQAAAHTAALLEAGAIVPCGRQRSGCWSRADDTM